MKVCCPLLVTLWLCLATLSSSSERCDDWGVDTMKQIQVYDGEPARIKCPLFEAFLKYNYSTAHSAGLTLIWYWIGQDRDLEEPINFRLPDNRISKEKDTLWFRPALLNDTGNYTCMLRNTTYCSKVAFPLEVVQKDQTSCVSQSIKPTEELFYLEHTNEKIICPDIDGFYPPSVTPTVNWYRNCVLVKGFHDRYPEGPTLIIGIVRSVYKGNYTCIVSYKENGRTYNLTRTIRMKVVGSPAKAMPPQFSSPNEKITYELEAGADLVLPCEVYFTFLKDSQTEVWWTVDGKNTDDITDMKIKVSESVSTLEFGHKDITRTLTISKVTPKDLKRNYTCHARNTRGEVHQTAMVGMKDGKEYDIYVSYARNAEEEEFVLLTLRGVLENEFGYKLCIFDRDSLPGGNTTEAVFDFIQRSRRMIVVLSPDYLTEKSISLLEFKLGIVCQNAISTKLIVVEYRPLQVTHPGILQLKESVSFVTWDGDKSKPSGSKFWKALRLALPLWSLSSSSGWNESCSSQSDISLDHVQRRRSRLKGQLELQSSRMGAAAQSGVAPAPRSKTKHRAKPFMPCQCCVTYCDNGDKLMQKSRAVPKSKWETHLCKPVSGGNRLEPPAAQLSALALCQYPDLSNNNDFCVL
ncbi:interleukin-1 receptor accessory protein isoform X2 [Natator depressus]|uniref:interleukin-1 receptor accessory protein isoform X2 n=1 Tax=Natator depressus TaxID=27790 RepID=UPI003EB8815D